MNLHYNQHKIYIHTHMCIYVCMYACMHACLSIGFKDDKRANLHTYDMELLFCSIFCFFFVKKKKVWVGSAPVTTTGQGRPPRAYVTYRGTYKSPTNTTLTSPTQPSFVLSFVNSNACITVHELG